MVQYTGKLNLYKPGGGLTGTNTPDETADIDKLNSNFDLIDAAAGFKVVTSSTRPGSPFTGQGIFETDTALAYVWSGSAWVQVGVTTVQTANIADSAVTTAKIADLNVTTGKLADSAVTTAKITDANVTTAKIADANVTTAKIANGAVTATQIADGTITAAKIATNTITAVQIAPDAIGSSELAAGAVGTSNLAANATIDRADGPSSDAYTRNAVGSGWYAVWMNSSYQFMRNTSSIKYKTNVEDWDKAEAVFALRPVVFDRIDNPDQKGEVGFIAEEVAEVLPEAIQYFEGEIDGIYDRPLIAALVAAVQLQQKQIAALEARLS